MRLASSLSLRTAAMAAGLGCAFLFSSAALAADSATTQYQQEVQRCNNTPGIDRAACLRDAGAALQAARNNGLTAPSQQAEERNKTQRCDNLPGDQRAECMKLMQNSNTRVQGSVEGGGILRETTITIPATGNRP